MIGTQPVASLAPLDYRYALDAAISVIARTAAPVIHCNVPDLMCEIYQRAPDRAGAGGASAGLWIEPLAEDWRAELHALASALPGDAPLVIVASLPPARLLPERRGWTARPLGFRPGGIGRLRRALPAAGLALQASYGIHSAIAIALNMLSRTAALLGRPDVGDRLHFAARLHYCITGPLAALSTVALLIARKEPGA